MKRIVAFSTLIVSVSLYSQEFKVRKTPIVKDHVHYISWLATKKMSLWLPPEALGPKEDMASALFTSLYACREKLGLEDKDWVNIHSELVPCMEEIGFKLMQPEKAGK